MAARRHRWPKCSASGKLRYRTHQDAVEALHRAHGAVWAAGAFGGSTGHRERRCYDCSSCGGYHLTSLG